jgi:hypothetical protein
VPPVSSIVQRPAVMRWKTLMWRSRASGVDSSQRFGLMTPNGAVNRPPKNTDPVSRTARNISDNTSGPVAGAARSGVPAKEGGVPIIVTSVAPADWYAHHCGLKRAVAGSADHRIRQKMNNGAYHVCHLCPRHPPGARNDVRLARDS